MKLGSVGKILNICFHIEANTLPKEDLVHLLKSKL